MKNVMDFLTAALPWLCMGLLLAVFFAKSAQKKNAKAENGEKAKENYAAEGMCLGMCFGTALGTSFGGTGIGLTLGMLAGLVLGSCIEKKDNG